MELPLFMRYNALSALEDSKINDLSHYYVKIRSPRGEKGAANLFLTDTDFSTLDDGENKHAYRIIKKWYPHFLRKKTLECGFFTGLGEGVYVQNRNFLPGFLETLADEIEKIAANEGADLINIRDVPPEKYEIYKKVLMPRGYSPVPGFPTSRIPIRWRSMEDFYGDLKSVTRNKFKGYGKKIKERFNISYEIITDYCSLAPELERLWRNVNEKSEEYSREILTASFFQKNGEYMDGSSEVILFKQAGRNIAFLFNMFDKEYYYTLDWGVDYSFEGYQQANLLKEAFLLSLERGIKKGCSFLDLGITNYDVKLALGAEAVPYVYFIKNCKEPARSKSIAQMLAKNISQPENGSHNPFKNSPQPEPIDMQQFAALVADDRLNRMEGDLFSKIKKFQDINVIRFSGMYNLYPEFTSAQKSSINIGDKEVVLLGTNSYLGAANHPKVLEAAKYALDKYGSGCSGSPMMNGTLDIHNKLEEDLADFMGKEAALLCSTGFQTNLAGLSALCGSGDFIIMDARSHRSLFDSAQMSGATVFVYRHNDMEHLEKILKRTAHKQTLIVSDSVFSMEGVMGDMKTISRLAKKYNARTYIDESHGVGVIGEKGRGVCELQGVGDDIDLIMGTFSKSFASIGGFIAGDREVVDYIKHKGSGHIFSASLPPSAVASVRAVLQIIKESPDTRRDILKKARFMADSFSAMGYDCAFHGTQIVPVVFGNEMLALAGYKKFMDDGVYVNPVIRPAVPLEATGFRTSYIATHEWADLEKALVVFEKYKHDLSKRT